MHRLSWKFGGRAPPQLQRVLALSPPRVGRLPSALLRTTCASPRTTVALEVFHPPSPLGEPDEEALRPTPLPADSCRTAGIERNGSAQNSPVCCRVQQTSLALKQRLPLTAVCSGNRFWRALGPPGDQSGDRLGSVGMRGLTPRGKDAPCATDSRTTYYETPAATTRSDRDTRRGPRTRVLAVITRRSAHYSLLRTHKPGSPLLPCSTHCSTAQTLF